MTSTSSRAMKLAAAVCALLTEQLVMACNTNPGKSKFALNLCNGETCYNDIQCTSGNCFEPGDIDQGLCMPVLQWWHILLIVLGGILLLALLILLICCCCRRQRASRLSRKLETHNHYYQQVPPNANTAYK